MLTEESIRADIEKTERKIGVFYRDIPNEDYHKGPGYSSSDIKAVVNGTLASWLEKKNNPKEQSPTMKLGTAIHTRILEPERFFELYQSDKPDIPARRGATKEVFEEWCNENLDIFTRVYHGKLDSAQWANEYIKWKFPNIEFLSEKDFEIVDGIFKSWESHPQIQQLFKHGESEISIYWIDKETNILCKCRPDKLNLNWPCIADLKSCGDASLDEFEGDITNYDYHISAFWYLWGCSLVFGIDLKEFFYIPCEKTPPYLISFYPADEGSLSLGEGLSRAGLLLFSDYEAAKKTDKSIWLGHSQKTKRAGVRPYAFNKLSQVIHRHDLHDRGLEQYVG